MKLENVLADLRERGGDPVLAKISALCNEDARLPLYTSDPTFLRNMRDAQLLRFKAALARYKDQHRPEVIFKNAHPGSTITYPALAQSWTIVDEAGVNDLLNEMHLSAQQNMVYEIHDILKAYYEVRTSVLRDDVSPDLLPCH